MDLVLLFSENGDFGCFSAVRLARIRIGMAFNFVIGLKPKETYMTDIREWVVLRASDSETISIAA
jgi:hypothetical protein